MLSDDELRAAFDKARWLSQKDHTRHGLRAVAEAAVKDAEQALCAVGGDEPFTYLWVRKNANTVRHLSSNTGPHPDWEVTPLYTRPQASAAVKDAVGGEAKDSDPCPNCMKGSVCRTIYCGRLKLPLDHPARSYDPSKRPQASAAVPDLSACFITAESGGEEYKVVLRFQTLAKMQDAHSAMVHWLAASQPEVRNAD